MNTRKALVLSCALAAFAASPAMAGAVEDMMAADKAFSNMSVAKGAHTAFLAYMADDVRLFDGDHPPIIGKAAVEDYYAKNPDSPDGMLGLTRGTWIYTGKNADGSAAKGTGYYVTEWRKEADGQYKFVLDIGGADKPEKTQ